MKKVVRLSENDLNRLVRRIVNEAPFDDSGLPKLGNIDNINNMDDDYIDYAMRRNIESSKKNREFEQGGFKIPMKAHDIRFLLSIANDDPNNRGRLESIQSLLDSEMRKNHTKF
jgi:hypothetical protein